MNLPIALKEKKIIYVIRSKSLTLACPFEAKYGLSNFKVLYVKFLVR